MKTHCTLLVVAGAVSLALAAETTTQPPKPAPASPVTKAAKKAATVKEGQVFTNEDLDKLFGPPPESAPAEEGAVPAPPTAESAPVPAPKAEKKAAADPAAKQAAIEKLEKKITELRESIPALEKRALAIHNPLLAPPQPPDDDRESWDAADSQQRLERTQTELKDARESLEEAEAELARLRASN
jgi:hypothetical protein